MGMTAANPVQPDTFRGYVLPHATIDTDLPVLDLVAIVNNVWDRQPVHAKSELNRRRLLRAEKQYRRFWLQCKLHRDRQLRPPNDLVDQLWREHIIHTEQYAAECDMFFGYFLHHRPMPLHTPH
jgi:hypothetical protein